MRLEVQARVAPFKVAEYHWQVRPRVRYSDIIRYASTGVGEKKGAFNLGVSRSRLEYGVISFNM